MDTISNQDFTEEECRRLRQSMKYDLISRLKVGDIQEKATIFQSVRVNDVRTILLQENYMYNCLD